MDTSFEEGKIEGKTEGKIEGKIEGKREAKIEVAKNMKAEGFTLSQIAKITGLTETEIEAL
jgi:predicted transposase/invertase (TIGR01784 family)